MGRKEWNGVMGPERMGRVGMGGRGGGRGGGREGGREEGRKGGRGVREGREGERG